MPFWEPTPIWDGQEVFVIGGGPSLRNFNWELLRYERTVGCNMAFRLGEDICDVCVFGDVIWYKHFKDDLKQFGNPVFTNATGVMSYDRDAQSWINFMEREPFGLHKHALAWNGHTGSVAINLALLFGASVVYLLGFDMGRTPDFSNWHDEIIRPNAVLPACYDLFLTRMPKLVNAWHKKFSDRQIVNLCAGTATIDGIPHQDLNLFFAGRAAGRMVGKGVTDGY